MRRRRKKYNYTLIGVGRLFHITDMRAGEAKYRHGSSMYKEYGCFNRFNDAKFDGMKMRVVTTVEDAAKIYGKKDENL